MALMMDGDPDEHEQLVSVGDATDLPLVSMKVVQSIYNDITGKSEKLGKRYDDDAFQVRMADLEQLHHKMSQACEQYDIKALNVAITVSHVNDTTETFSSFDRFRLYNQSNTNAVQNVVVTYNVLMLLPKLNKPQSYEIMIRVASGVTSKSMMFRLPDMIVKVIGDGSGSYSIKYVDYLVARNLAMAVEGWFEALTRYSAPSWLKFARRYSEYFIPLAEYSMAFFMLWMVLRVTDAQLSLSADFRLLSQVLLISMSILFVSYRFGRFIGQKSQEAVTFVRDLGFIALNRGDDKEIASAEAANRRTLLKGALAVALEFLIATAAHFCALALSH
jgi:hypothetical protein